MDYALNQLGISHNTVRIDQFETINLAEYDIVLVGSFIGVLDEVKKYLDAKASEIESWIVSGGSLGVFSQFVGGALYDLNGNLVPTPGSGYFSWVPDNPSFVSWASDRAHIVDADHPITHNLTDEDLSGWYTSPDGYFSSFPGQALIVHSSAMDRVAVYTYKFRLGEIIGACMDADYHTWFNRRGDEGKNDAKIFLKNIIDWLSAPPIRATINVFPGTLNLKSKGKLVTCYIGLPQGFNVSDIDVSSLLLNGTIHVVPKPTSIGDHDSDGVPDLMVKFERQAIIGWLKQQGICSEQVTFTVTGTVAGNPLGGDTVIRIISPPPDSI